MKSRTSWFNFAISKNYLRRCWPLWTSYFAILLLLFPIDMADRLSRVNQYTISLNRAVLQAGITTGYISIAASVLAVMLMFSWLYSAKGSGMMCSLPVRRETLFVTAFLTGLVPMLIADVAAVLLSAALTVGSGYFSFSVYMEALAVLVMMNFSFYCFAVFCAVLTGNIIILPVVFVVLNCAVFVAESCLRATLSTFVYGMYNTGSLLHIFSPLVYVIGAVAVGNAFTSPYNMAADTYTVYGLEALGIYCAVGLALSVGAILILRRRNMELASDVVAVPILKPVFKYCLTGGCAVVFAPLIYQNIYSHTFIGWQAAAINLLLMLVGALIGYLAAEMLIQKTVMVFKSLRWKGFVISCCAVIAFVAAFELDVFGFERRLPRMEKIQQVEIWQGDTVLAQPENIQLTLELHQQLIDNKAINEVKGSSDVIYINYLMKNGKYVSRYYQVPASRLDEPDGELMRFQALCNLQEAIDRRCKTELPVTVQTVTGFGIHTWYHDSEGQYQDEYIQLSPAQAVDFYENYLLPDIQAGTMGRYWFLNNAQHYETAASLRFELNLSNRSMLSDPEDHYNRKDEYFSFTLNMDAERCLQWLRENTDIEPLPLGIAENRQSEAK